MELEDDNVLVDQNGDVDDDDLDDHDEGAASDAPPSGGLPPAANQALNAVGGASVASSGFHASSASSGDNVNVAHPPPPANAMNAEVDRLGRRYFQTDGVMYAWRLDENGMGGEGNYYTGFLDGSDVFHFDDEYNGGDDLGAGSPGSASASADTQGKIWQQVNEQIDETVAK